MTRKQATWAARHDWFNGALQVGTDYYGRAVMLVTVTEVVADGPDIIRRFTDFQELRAWAGY